MGEIRSSDGRYCCLTALLATVDGYGGNLMSIRPHHIIIIGDFGHSLCVCLPKSLPKGDPASSWSFRIEYALKAEDVTMRYICSTHACWVA